MKIFHALPLLSLCFVASSSSSAQSFKPSLVADFKHYADSSFHERVLFIMDGIPLEQEALKGIKPEMVKRIKVVSPKKRRKIGCTPTKVIIIHKYKIKKC